MKKLSRVLVVLGFLAALGIGCSNNDSISKPLLEGTYHDSAVEGLEYETETITGITDAGGIFKYRAGETIIFFVGDTVVGSCLAAEVLTPINLVDGATDASHPIVINIVRFLLTLDDDANPDNGILINEAVRAAAIGISIDLEDIDDDGSSANDGSRGSYDSSGDAKSSGSGHKSSGDNYSNESNHFEEEFKEPILALAQNNTVVRQTLVSVEEAVQHFSMTQETLYTKPDNSDTVPSIPDQDDTVPSIPDQDDTVPSIPDQDDTVPSIPDQDDTVPSPPPSQDNNIPSLPNQG